MILSGEQGSAKTTLEELIKMLVDPSPIKTCSFPRDVTEFIQQLAHNYVMAYDNISVIRDWVSDLLCRAITGSGFSKRELYTTDNDFIYNIMRCVLLNGITIAATKADLLDRSLIIQLQDITDDKRRKIEDLWKEFDEIKPELLGYIFDLLVKVLAWKKEHGSPNIILFRMADWTEYGEIIARCMGCQDNEFLKAYNENIGIQLDEVISSSPVATALINYIVSKDSNFDYETTATEWLNKLTEYAQAMGIDTRYKSWPKSASYLSRRLKELEKTLRDIGINIEWSKTPDTRARLIKIRKVSSMPSVSSGNQNQARNSEHEEGVPKGTDDTDDTLHTFEAEDSSQQEPPPDAETETETETEDEDEDEDILSKLMKDNPDPRPPGYSDSKQ